MYIYKITNLVTNMVYIGQTNNFKHRRYSHLSALRNNKHTNKHLQYAWNKYTEDVFEFSIIQDNIDVNDIDDLEIKCILLYKANDRNFGYNKDSGGNSKKIVSDETKQLLSKINKENPTRPMLNKKHSEKSKQLMRKPKHSISEKLNMSKRAKLRTKTLNPFYGKQHTIETKVKLSNYKKIPVFCITNGILYDCAKSASISTGISQSYITHVCAGKYSSAKGFQFKYQFLGLK